MNTDARTLGAPQPARRGPKRSSSHRPSTRAASLLIALVVLALIAIWAADPAIPDSQSASNSALTNAPHPSRAPDAVSEPATLRRSVPEWLPDGNVWVRPLTPDGQHVSTVGVAWATASDRQVALQLQQPIADGWLVVAPPPHQAGNTSLALAVSGLATLWLSNPDPQHRLEVTLKRPLGARMRVVDAETGHPLPRVQCYVGRRPLDTVQLQPDAIGGPDVDQAIHSSLTDQHGIAVFVDAVPGDAYHYELSRKWYVIAESSPARADLADSYAALRMRMPYVGAIKYVGDRVVEGSVSVRSRAVDSPTASRLVAVKAAMTGNDDGMIAVAVFHAPGDPLGPPAGSVDVLLAASGRRQDKMTFVRYQDYTGPVLIRPEPGEAVVLAPVTVLPPDDFASGVKADFPIMLASLRSPRPRVVRFGETTHLPVGSYMVVGSGMAARLALKPDVIEVESSAPIVHQAHWNDGVCHYSIAVESHSPVSKVHVSYSRDGKTCVTAARSEAPGRFGFWLSFRLSAVRVFATGHEPCDVTLSMESGASAFRGSCLLKEK